MAYAFVSETTGKPLKRPRKRVKKVKKVNWKTAKPVRFPSGKANYEQTRKVSKMIENISETKLQPLTEYNSQGPSPIEVAPTTGPCYFTNYCLGTAPAAWVGPSGSAAFKNLDGFNWPQGTAANQRVGRYLYLKRTTLQLRISMMGISRTGATKFRVIVYKEKRNKYNVAGGGNPCDNLFIDHNGDTRGINNVAPVNSRIMNFSTWLLNRRNYHVVKDFKFSLAPEQQLVSGSTDPANINQGMLKSDKVMQFKLGHYQKTEFDASGDPTDSLYRYCVSIISMSTTNTTVGHNAYASDVRGTVSVVDN